MANCDNLRIISIYSCFGRSVVNSSDPQRFIKKHAKVMEKEDLKKIRGLGYLKEVPPGNYPLSILKNRTKSCLMGMNPSTEDLQHLLLKCFLVGGRDLPKREVVALLGDAFVQSVHPQTILVIG